MNKSSTRSPKGKFPKGTSGNPSGRPQGSRNKSTLLLEALLDEDAAAIITKAAQLAKKGNVFALKLCVDRLLPPRKDRTIDLELRPIESPQDLPLQFQDIIKAVGEGRITPAEAESLSNFLTVTSIHSKPLTSTGGSKNSRTR